MSGTLVGMKEPSSCLLPPALVRALYQVKSGLVRAGRDMELVALDAAAAIEAACAAAPEFLVGSASSAEAVVDLVDERIRGISGLSVTLPVAPKGLVSTAVHLAVVVALRKQLLPALYRLEAIFQPRVHESAETAEAITLDERIRGISGLSVTLPVAPKGLVSTAVHLAVVVALRKRLLPALYRLEAILQPRVHESAETAEAITLVERARRRMGGSAEALREVALAGPQADPRFPGEEQSLAARALGFINQAEKVQLKLAPGNLRPGGTWDAALETLLQLDLLDAVLAHISGTDQVRQVERRVQPWPAMGTLLLARIDECVAASGAPG